MYILSSENSIDRMAQKEIEEVIENNEYIKYSSWKWHEAGLPVLRTRYVELVEYERGIFIPIAFIIYMRLRIKGYDLHKTYHISFEKYSFFIEI